MLLTLSTRSLSTLIAPRGDGSLTMLDAPAFAIQKLRLRGLNVVTSMLAGWSFEELDGLRDRADKAGCPCLVLIEDTPMALAAEEPEVRQAARDRLRTLTLAANRLACNWIALRFDAPDTDEAFERLVEEIRSVMPVTERHQLNLLVAPHDGVTYLPDRLIELIKRVGTFRIGAMPSFAHAASTGETVKTLRKLAPYSGAIHATVTESTKNKRGEKNGYDLKECVLAIRSVGFPNTLAIDYTGNGNALTQIDRAREILQEAIEIELE